MHDCDFRLFGLWPPFLLVLCLVKYVLLHVVADLVLLGRVSVPPHGPDRMLEEIVHRLDRAAFELRHTEIYKHSADVSQDSVEEECSPAHMGHHAWRGFGDSVVDDPVDEEANRHGERAYTCREDLGRHNIRCN